MALSGARFEITAGSYRAEVAEVGAGLAGLWQDGAPVTVPYPDSALPKMSNGAVLVPWPNRIRDGKYRFQDHDHQLPLTEPAHHNASHGLVRFERWSVLERDAGQVTLGLDLVPQTGYEFELRASLRYGLSADAGLRVRLQVENLGAEIAPFGAGFHPYFDLGGVALDEVQLEIPAATRLLTDDQLIPVGSEPVAGTEYDLQTARPLRALRLDIAYSDLSARTARLRAGNRVTELSFDDSFQYLQVFTPPVQRFGQAAVAIEPLTCPADSFNSGDGLITLSPGGQWSAEWGILSLLS